MVGTLIVISAALLIRFALHDYIKPLGVFPIFIISTLVVQYRYGYKYSILALAASVIIPFCRGLRSRTVMQPWPDAALV